MSEPKQIIVMRKDLGMRKGKMIAQGAHASLKVFMDRAHPIHTDCDVFPVGFEEPVTPYNALYLDLTKMMYEWTRGRFTKVCVSVDSEEALLAVYEKAKEADLPCALIEDAGLTEFKGVPTKTCCAIGPAAPDDLDPITGELKLL